MQEMKVLSLGREDILEEEMETHSVFLPRKSLGQSSRGTTVNRMAKESDITDHAHTHQAG